MSRDLVGLTLVDHERVRAAVRAVLAASAATFLAFPTFAQEGGTASRASTAALEEVVVTAQRREQSIQDVPIMVSAFTAKDIEARAARNLVDLAMTTPNVSFNNSVTGQNIRIRGVGAGDTNLIFDPGVGVYIDGLYLPRMNGMNLDLVGIERVEVLRGPQGTLFGRNTIGGAINVTSSKPSRELAGYAELIGGDYGLFEGRASLEGPIGEAVAGRLGGTIRQRDGYGERLEFGTDRKLDEADNVDRYAVRGSLNWTPSENVDVVLNGDVSSADEKGQLLHIQKTFATSLVNTSNLFTTPKYNDQFVTADGHTNYATGPNSSKTDSWSTSLLIDWKLGDKTTFKSITAYFDQDSSIGNDLDGSNLNLFEQNVSESSSYFSQEFQLAGQSMNDSLNWLTGVYYGSETGHLHGESYIFDTLYKSPLKVDASQKLDIWTDNWNAALFGQGTYKFTDKFSMTAGLRYSYDNKQVARQRASMYTGAITVPYLQTDDNWTAWSGRFGFEYRWSPDVMGYVSAARGFKSGGINGASTSNAAFLPFNPEFLWTYEAGVRSEWYDRRLRANASVFYSNYSDMQFRYFFQSPTGLIQIVDNVGAAKLKGVELELQAAVTDGLVLSAGVGYLDSKYTKALPGSPITLDDKLVDAPEWTLTLAGDYSTKLSGGSGILVHLDYTHRTEQERLLHNYNFPYGVQPGYGLLNARLAFTTADGHWEAAVYGTNLTDEEILKWAYDISTAMNVFGEYDAPRMWGASVKYKF